MKLHLSLCAVLLLACGDNSPSDPVADNCEAGILATPPSALDLLVILDTSQAMRPYEAQLSKFSGELAAVIDNLNGGRPNLHLGALSADSARPLEFIGSDCVDGSAGFINDQREPWWKCGDESSERCGEGNFKGDFADALECVLDTNRRGNEPAMPLERMRSLLLDDAGAEGGFLRGTNPFAVVTVTASDDSSSDNVARYVDDQLAAVADESYALRASITADESPRLTTFNGDDGTVVSIDDAEWSTALVKLSDTFSEVLATPCLSEAIARIDSDETMAGLQLDCTTELAGETIPACTMASDSRPSPDTALPCFWLEPQTDTNDGCDYSPRIELPLGAAAGAATLSCDQSLCD